VHLAFLTFQIQPESSAISALFRADIDNVVWRVADDEAVLLQVDSSAYFGVNQTGTRLWAELAERPMTLEQLVGWAQAEFPDAPPSDALRAELSAFLEELGALTLLRREDDNGAVPAVVSLPTSGKSPSPPRWETPAVERFGELEKLILSGE